MFWCTAALILQLSLLHFVGIVADVNGPQNVTITFLNSVSVKISWSVALPSIERYDIMYKPTNSKVVAVLAANFNSVTLRNLLPDTQYQMTVSAIHAGKKYRSRPIVFRTLDGGAVVTDAITTNDNETAAGNVITLGTPDIVIPNSEDSATSTSVPPPPYGSSNTPQTYIQGCGRRKRAWDGEPLDILKNVRGIEVTIVVLVLLVWVGAIILFFNRWGKIRMLIPYQPDYKETQLKVPGTGACSSANTYQNPSGSALCCSQRNAYPCLKPARHHKDCIFAGSLENATARRARFQSVSCQYMKQESQNVPVRKSKSADYIPFTYGRYDHYRYRAIKKIPTVSISIASDSDGGGGLNDDSS